MFGTRRGSLLQNPQSVGLSGRGPLPRSRTPPSQSTAPGAPPSPTPPARPPGPRGQASAHSHADGRSTGNRTLRHSADRSDPYSHTRERVGFGWFRFTHFPWTQCRLWRLACGRDPGARGRLMHVSRVHIEYTSHRVRPKHPAKHESYVLGRPYRRPAAYVHSGVDPPFTPTPFTPAPRLDRARPPPLPSSIIRSIIWSMVSTAQVRIHRYHSQGRSLDDWAAA